MRWRRRTGSIRCRSGPASGEALRVIGAISQVLVAPEDAGGAARAPWPIRAVRIVTLTVTEKGYCHDPATGDLDEAPSRHRPRPRRIRDRAALGARLHRRGAARRRRAAGVAPFTVLSCDNLPSNGRTVKQRDLPRFAALRDPDLGAFVAARGRLPVHAWSTASCRPRRTRIAPAIAAALGVRGRLAGRDRAVHAMGDRGPFPDRPAGLGGGRRRVRRRTSSPTSMMKLRLLNGSAFDARLSRLSRRATRRSRTPWRIPAFATLVTRPDGRGGHADAAHAARRRSRRLQGARSSSASATRR